MDNRIGENVKQYRNVVIRASEIGDNAVLGDDVFVTDSVIGKRCTIERRGMVFGSVIGDYSYTGFNTVVKHAQIGKFCSIAWNVSIGGADHDFERLTTHPFPLFPKYGITDTQENYGSFEEPLVIGNDVWIAANVCITRGAKIGNGAVIGAGSVVTKDIPPYAIAYGNPAKIHGYRFDEKTIEAIERLEWWNWTEDKLRENIDLFRKPVDEQRLKIIETRP